MIDVQEPPSPDQLPEALFELSDAYLDSAYQLNSAMKNGAWPSSYRRGQVVLYLALHATELALKGCIKKLDPSFNSGHMTISLLNERLTRLCPSIEFFPPFGTEPVAIDMDDEVHIQDWEKVAHQLFRYPMDRKGKPWDGVFGYSADMFDSSLLQLRNDFAFMRRQVLLHAPKRG